VSDALPVANGQVSSPADALEGVDQFLGDLPVCAGAAPYAVEISKSCKGVDAPE